MVIAVRTYSQEYIGSNTKFSKESEHCNKDTAICRFSAGESGIISLNAQNDEFSFTIPFFKILTSPKNNDSITDLNKNILVRFRGKFPISNLDFYNSNATESSFTFPGELTINEITQPVNLTANLFASVAIDDASRGLDTYPVRINFRMEINPADFKLDFETINFVRSITLEVRNGIINKTENVVAE
jgi:hypothetical protein